LKADAAGREERIVLLRRRVDLENRAGGGLEGKQDRLINPSPRSPSLDQSG